MNAYRDAPPKAARRAFDFRGRGSGAPLVIALVFGGFLGMMWLNRVYVRCSRADDICTYGTIGALSEKHTVRLSTVSSLDVVTTRRNGLSTLAFETENGPQPFNFSDNINAAAKEKLARQVTAFVQSRDAEIDVGYGPNPLLALALVLVIGGGIAFVVRGGPTAQVVYEASGDVAFVASRASALSLPRSFELAMPRTRVWRGKLEIYGEDGTSVSLPVAENDPQARGLAAVLRRD